MTSLRSFLLAATAVASLPAVASAEAVMQINSSLPEGSFAHVFLVE